MKPLGCKGGVGGNYPHFGLHSNIDSSKFRLGVVPYQYFISLSHTGLQIDHKNNLT